MKQNALGEGNEVQSRRIEQDAQEKEYSKWVGLGGIFTLHRLNMLLLRAAIAA